MSTNLSKLNDALFDQLNRLNDPSLKGDDLESEIKRAQSVTTVSREIVSNGRLVLDAERHRQDFGSLYRLPAILESKGGK